MAAEFGTGGLAILALIGISSLVGDFYVKYCVVKAGTYVPLRGLGPMGRGVEQGG